MSRPTLFLEQRIAIMRKRLNEDTLRLKTEEEIRQFAMDGMLVLDGWDWNITPDECERFHIEKSKEP